MIFVSHSLPVNDGTAVSLTRQQVWDGLVLKANNALPYVASMTDCVVTERYGNDVFDRDIVLRGQPHTERIHLQEPRRVVFTRIAGPVLGTIANEIEGDDDDLHLRFSFALVVSDVAPGSRQERDYADTMTDDYFKAVDSTLGAMRRSTADSASQETAYSGAKEA